MKYILAVLTFFVLVSLGVGVYFFQKSQTIQTQIQAARTTNVLPVLIDDCNYRYLHNCVLEPAGVGIEVYVRSQTKKIIDAHAADSIKKHSESPDAGLLKEFTTPSNMVIDTYRSSADLITLVSMSTRIHYKLLLAIFALQGESAWRGDSPASNPLNRKEISYFGQFVGLATDLTNILESETETPSASVSVGKTEYIFDKNTNIASRALYVYFATTAKDSSEFEQLIGRYSRVNTRNIWNVWWRLFGEPAFSATPNQIELYKPV